MTHTSTVFTSICPEQPVLLCYDCSIMVSLTFTEIYPQKKTRQGHRVKSILSWKEILTGLLVVLPMGYFSKWLLQMSPLSVSYLPVVLQTGHLFQFPSCLQYLNLLMNCSHIKVRKWSANFSWTSPVIIPLFEWERSSIKCIKKSRKQTSSS